MKDFETTRRGAIADLCLPAAALLASSAPAVLAGPAVAQTAPRAPLAAAEIARRLGASTAYLDDFDAGFPDDMVWRPACLTDDGAGGLALHVARNTTTARPFMGGSVQLDRSVASGEIGRGRLYRYDAWVQLAPPVSGMVQTLFTFPQPWNGPRREIDFEFNGGTGRMECTLHLQPLDRSVGSKAMGVSVDVPAAAFTGARKWSILANADRIEWLYENQLLARYVQGAGFDPSVQAFNPRKCQAAGTPRLAAGDVWRHPNDAGWHLSRNNFFLQHWASRLHGPWIGPLSLPASAAPFRASKVRITHFTDVSTALPDARWAATSGGPGLLTIHVSGFEPAGMGFRPTGLEVSLNGGPWVRARTAIAGANHVSGAPRGTHRIRVRVVAAGPRGDYTLTSRPGGEKVVTVA